MSAPVEVSALTHSFDDLAVIDAVSFAVGAGQCFAVIGPTGCGKSTLLRILAGLELPTGGDVQIAERSVIGRPGAVAFMPQADTLLPWRRALDNVLVGAQVLGRDKGASRRDAHDLFAHFGLGGFERAWPRELSGGMRQRVALLRTILAERPVLALDEPFGALDAITRTELQTWLGLLLLERAHTTVLVTHDIDEALRLSHRIVVLSPRPATVRAELTPPGEPPRSPARITEPDLATMKRDILGLLDAALG